MAKIHVPSQAAGNTGLVARKTMVAIHGNEQVVTDSAPKIGGLHFYGLCGDCNQLQNRYDGD